MQRILPSQFPLKIVCLVIFSVFCFGREAAAEVNQKGDFQFWNQQSIKIPLTAKWDLKGVSEFRYGDNGSFFFAKYYQGQLMYKMLLWLTLSPGYRQMWMRSKGSLNWQATRIPFVDAMLQGNLARWGISNRTRAAYHMKESGEKYWVLRNRLMLTTPFRLTRLCISPYFSEEVFFKKDEGFVQNRLIAGVITLYSRNFTSKLYYMVRSDKHSGQWRNQNVVGLHFDFSF